jgi:uncharacterized protein (DUF488 family)
MNQTIYTIGYGGRRPSDLMEMLRSAGVGTVVDVRLRPDRASMGSYVRAKKDDKGIAALLAGGGIRYRGLPELGNPFLDDAYRADWQPRYEALLAVAAPLLMVRLDALLGEADQAPLCLMCAEKDPSGCHRTQIARLLQRRGHTVVHLT